jgi:hypothetical protein
MPQLSGDKLVPVEMQTSKKSWRDFLQRRRSRSHQERVMKKGLTRLPERASRKGHQTVIRVLN